MLAYEYINRIGKSDNKTEILTLLQKAQKNISVSDLDFYGIKQEYFAKFKELTTKL